MKMNVHKDRDELARSLANKIAADLTQAIQEHGSAHMLVSGGSSPKPLFAELSKLDIAWSKVLVGLVDERFVANDHEKSNARLVSEHLLIEKAASASFAGMVFDTDSYNRNLWLVSEAYRPFRDRIDVVVLGMGGDGHTASLFPTDPSSRQALAEDFTPLLANTSADVEPYKRITCTKKFLHQAYHLYLLIAGTEKRAVLENAEQNNLPIAAFFKTERTQLETHYSD